MMLSTLVYFTVIFAAVNALSIEKVSDKQNVSKRAANGDFFPDWVPFKNKHGDELGEFQQVPKAKVKKRLAPPVNFILRAVAEPEGDDYFDKAQGETDSDEYFDKKDWSDVNRPAEAVDPTKVIVNHTDISDIDGVVDIITKGKPSVILNALQNSAGKQSKKPQVTSTTEAPAKEELKEEKEEETQLKHELPELQLKENKKDIIMPNKYEEDNDYEDTDSEKPTPEKVDDDQSDNDAKKASILDSVDELKERHAEEQRAISEKAKEEEIYQEEHERNKIVRHEKFNKYDTRDRKKEPNYDEYDDKEESVHEKYKVQPSRGTTKTSTRQPVSMGRKDKKDEVISKLSVFKNPQLYMVYDDDSEETTTKKPTTKSPSKFSSKYTTPTPETEESERISLVPHDPKAKEGEPTLFFPKTRKHKKRRKNKTTTSEPDSSVAETVTDPSAKDFTTAFGFTSPSGVGTGPSGTETGPSGSETGPSGVDTTSIEAVSGPSAQGITSTGSDTTATGPDTSVTGSPESAPSGSAGLTPSRLKPSGFQPSGLAEEASHTVLRAGVTDAVPASTDHKEKKKHEDYHKEKGGGREFHAEHSEEHEEHGKKAYEGVHKDEKTAKGHHDKEDHLGKYEDKGGHDKHHHEESGHYGDHHHEEHGKKHAKYEESGKHSKGHSTKGSHDIHKKEEYEKKVEFFEEEGDSAEEEKHGGYHNDREHKAGGNFKKGNLKADHIHHDKGESGHFHKGGHSKINKGHRQAEGYDSHGKRVQGKHQKEGGAAGKKWVYHHGYPAKNANLVIIDRRADQYYHGPQYYG